METVWSMHKYRTEVLCPVRVLCDRLAHNLVKCPLPDTQESFSSNIYALSRDFPGHRYRRSSASEQEAGYQMQSARLYARFSLSTARLASVVIRQPHPIFLNHTTLPNPIRLSRICSGGQLSYRLLYKYPPCSRCGRGPGPDVYSNPFKTLIAPRSSTSTSMVCPCFL